MAADDTITFELAKTDKALTGPVVGEFLLHFRPVFGEEHHLASEGPTDFTPPAFSPGGNAYAHDSHCNHLPAFVPTPYSLHTVSLLHFLYCSSLSQRRSRFSLTSR